MAVGGAIKGRCQTGNYNITDVVDADLILVWAFCQVEEWFSDGRLPLSPFKTERQTSGRCISPKLPDRMLTYVRTAYRYGNGCYGLCAWLPWKNIDLVLKGCGHILDTLPIVMIIRPLWVTSEWRWAIKWFFFSSWIYFIFWCNKQPVAFFSFKQTCQAKQIREWQQDWRGAFRLREPMWAQTRATQPFSSGMDPDY